MIKEIMRNDILFLTSDNFKNFNGFIFGYIITDGELSINENKANKKFDLFSGGMYCNAIVDDDSIIIQQDFHAGGGIYLFRHGSYWAVSNSFYCLIQNLAGQFEFTVDEEWIAFYLIQRLVPNVILETPLKEIVEIPQGRYLKIDRNTGALEVCEEVFSLYNIPLLSAECAQLLDQWRNKYVRLVKAIITHGFNISVDLSGGMDSRAAFALARHADFTRGNACVFSLQDTSHREDLAIANEIVGKLGLPLNKRLKTKTIPISNRDSLAISFIAKFLMHDELYFGEYYNERPRFSYGGSGGEGMRAYWRGSMKEFIAGLDVPEAFIAGDILEKARACIERTFDFMLKNYKVDFDPSQFLHNMTRMKYHSMKSFFECAMVNRYTIAPLLDPLLYKLDVHSKKLADRNLLFAIIYDRYCPEIADIPFQGGRNIEDCTWKIARDFNRKYPFCGDAHIERPYTIREVAKIDCAKIRSAYNRGNQDKFMADLFSDVGFIKSSIHDYGYELYKFAYDYYHTTPYHGESYLNKLYSLYILKLLLKGGVIGTTNLQIPYANARRIHNFIRDIQTARIDITYSSITHPSNEYDNLEIVAFNDQEMEINRPAWLKTSSGQGLNIHSRKNHLSFRLRAKSVGEVTMLFASYDMRKIDFNQRMDNTIDYISISLASEDGAVDVNFQNIYGCCLNKPFMVKFATDDDTFVDVDVLFFAHDYSFMEFSALVEEFFNRYLNA